MALKSRRDKLGRSYWVDTATGRRAKAPEEASRPRAYAVDKRGRGYWTYLDTGRRAPKPTWETARYDKADRPIDSRGRRVPRAAIAEPTVYAPSPPIKGKVVRAKYLRTPKFRRISYRKPVPGFKGDFKGVYTTRPTYAPPRDLQTVFRKWLGGAVRKSPVASSAGEVSIRQSGVVFRIEGDADDRDWAKLVEELRGENVRLVIRAMGRGEWEIWMHLNNPRRRTDIEVIPQQGYRKVISQFEAANRAARKIYDFLDDLDVEFTWNEYIETDEELYEG